MASRERLLLTLVAAIAAARVLLQVAVMPPYAGLDEIYHVGRVDFVLEQRRNPTSREPSFPSFLEASLEGLPGAPPDFAHRFATWPELRARGFVIDRSDTVLPQNVVYASKNYEAQQPSLYYWLAAGVTSASAGGTQLGELRALRLMSALFGVITVMAAALIGRRLFGPYGILAAALIPLLPTWETLLIRASNDALACAALAGALLLSVRGGNRRGLIIAEAAAWCVALGSKLFTWPVGAALLMLLGYQRASRFRWATVIVPSALVVLVTMADLDLRTGNPTGLFAFDRPPSAATVAPQPIHYAEMLKVLVASGVWTSGQHNDALTPLGMLLFILPIVAAAVASIALLSRERPRRWLLALVAITCVSFAAAQIVNAAGYIRQARAAGTGMPAGGKEGWYWYALASFLISVVLAPAMQRWRAVAPISALWLLSWDVLIAEGALFRDYAGLSTAASPGLLFRWGPAPRLSPSIYADVSRFAVGPLTSITLLLRILTIAGLVIMLLVIARPSRREADAG